MGALRTARTTGLGRTPGLPAGEKRVTSRWPGTRITTVVLPPRLLTPLSKYSFKTVFRFERKSRLRQDDQLNKNNNRGVVSMASYPVVSKISTASCHNPLLSLLFTCIKVAEKVARYGFPLLFDCYRYISCYDFKNLPA